MRFALNYHLGMKCRLIVLALLAVSVVLLLPAQEVSWRLVWADEFNYQGLPNPSRWRYDVGGHGWGNNELQFYTANRRQNARVLNGRLIIEARKEPWQGRDYTSVRLLSKQTWTYGKFEMRAKLPSGRGTWPAIWMLPINGTYGNLSWPDNGEIDIMEHVGFDPDIVHASIHTAAYNHTIGTQKTSQIFVPGARTRWNIYSVEWNANQIDAFVNGRRYFTFPNERLQGTGADWRQWPFDRDFFVLLNIAVGGNWGGAKGVDPSIWPQRMEVDYVRVYQRK